MRTCLAIVFCLLLHGSVLAAGTSPAEPELRSLQRLKGKLQGLIVWESNRTGAWELYVMNADGTGARQLTRLAKAAKGNYQAYLRPQLSPDGRTVLFGYGKHGSAAEVWVVSMQGSDARRVCAGVPLNWSADGRQIYLVRDSQVLSHDFQTGQESVVNGTKVPVDGKSGSTVGTYHPSLQALAVRTSKLNEYFVFENGKTIKTTGGCEPRLSADGKHMYWVQGPKDFRVWDIRADTERQMLGKPPTEPFNYTYFPTVSADNRWLVYAASPNQHDHSTSDYELYVQQLENWTPTGEPVRLSFNTATDRWPYLWVAPPGSAQLLPAGQYDVDGNRNTNPPPAPRMLCSFAKADAKPEFGGSWGLWPQQADCKGTATFMPGEDAEGGAGGAMKIDYLIQADPRSFSLFINADAAADLTSWDHFIVYARGTVPSFTLVVKDRNAGDAGAPQGIADFIVKGLTSQWQRFEAPFAAFTPRQRGGKIDWRAINHLGIAMIAPQNSKSGTFWVDNIRVEAAPLH
jgi:hypothetical protein